MRHRLYLIAALLLVASTILLGLAIPSHAYSGTFLSYPHQSGRTTVSGNDVVVSKKSWVGFTSGACLTVSNAHNVDITDVDFDGCGGGIFLINVTGTIHIEGVRC